MNTVVKSRQGPYKLLFRILKIAVITVLWLGIWQTASWLVGNEILLPSPLGTVIRIGELAVTDSFWQTIAMSLLRVTTGIVIAVILGILTAGLCFKSRFAYDAILPAITVIKATPVASFIFLILLWTGRDTATVIITALIVFPIIWGNVIEGLKNIDVKLLEFAKCYRLPFTRRLRRITIPCVMPYFFSAVRTSLGLGWKAGIAAEALVMPSISIGKMLYFSKSNLETKDLFAWTVTVIILSLLIELLFVSLLKKLGRKYNIDKK